MRRIVENGFLQLILLGGCLSTPSGTDEGTAEHTNGSSSSGETEETTSGGMCGDGVKDAGEGCDDGNKMEEDGCLQTCEAARCGDGFVWMGVEACDDGNVVDGDGCPGDCKAAPGKCGDGEVEGVEECDDGNDDDEDGCPGTCEMARCGDGFVQAGVEVCDDGNDVNTDGCVGTCEVASCGDGFVEEGVEGCDDGNEGDEDACPSGVGACMAVAGCGDGFVEAGVEECDDQGLGVEYACSAACASARWVFITSDNPANGNLGGIAGADAYCQMSAENAGLGGTYMAWLTDSDPETAPVTRFGSVDFKGWYRLPGDEPIGVAEGWTDLTSPNDGMPLDYLQSAIYVTEAGVELSDANAWTNTKPDGTQASKNDGENCSGWTVSDGNKTGLNGYVKVGVLDSTWTVDIPAKCSFGLRLYCFQVG